MTEAETESFYRRYIRCLNDRRTDALGEFVQDELTYNGERITRFDYQLLIDESIAAIPGLCFDVRLLVVGHDQIGCHLVCDCTPQDEFLGFQPNGKRLSFAEHMFYRLREGKIAEVWSLIDRPAIQRQLAA